MIEACRHTFLSSCHNAMHALTDGMTERKAFDIPCVALHAVAR